jgi:2-polyprenyl-3-methyl-5-hydroxy-6-metoxy-1,4-benzoquinol methylase
MNYQPESIAQHFDQYGEREWERLVSTPVDEISLYLHTQMLQQYVPAGSRVLEVGAGAGRFTQVLAAIGARVVVADISAEQIRLNRHYADQYGFAAAVEDWQVVDICDLSRYADGTFDRVVAYGGPFSYVLERRDQALAECMRVLRPEGLLLGSVMCVHGTIHRYLPEVLEETPAVNQNVIRTGDIIPATIPERKGHFMHMFRAKELREWLESSGLRISTMSASGVLANGYGSGSGSELDPIRQDPVKWAELLRMEQEASAEPGCLDMGTHLIFVTGK